MGKSKKTLIVACPQCKKEFSYYVSESRPFCSETCKNHDFLNWTEESHRIPSKKHLSESDLQTVLQHHEVSDSYEH